MESEPDTNEFTYFIGVENAKGTIPDDFAEKDIPAVTWAIFEFVGPMPNAIQNLNKRIYSEWFPTTGYSIAS